MNVELQTNETSLTEEQVQYVFVVDADLAHIGGGSALVDY